MMSFRLKLQSSRILVSLKREESITGMKQIIAQRVVGMIQVTTSIRLTNSCFHKYCVFSLCPTVTHATLQVYKLLDHLITLIFKEVH